MVSAESKSIIERAKEIYTARLQAELESLHRDRFMAIEPELGANFLGDTIDAAEKSARSKHPTRISHVVRIGHPAALPIGGSELVASTGSERRA